jgi:hypothetical protein
LEQIQPGQPSGYALGHTEDELDRIINVGRFLGDLTEHVLRLAGLAPGMRVLDATLVVPPWIGAWTRTPLTKQ